jgi:hypothetical protein
MLAGSVHYESFCGMPNGWDVFAMLGRSSMAALLRGRFPRSRCTLQRVSALMQLASYDRCCH